MGQLSKEVCTGLSLKKGEPDPPLSPDSEYPEWLWKLLETPASVSELERKYQKDGLTMEEVRDSKWNLRHEVNPSPLPQSCDNTPFSQKYANILQCSVGSTH